MRQPVVHILFKERIACRLPFGFGNAVGQLLLKFTQLPYFFHFFASLVFTQEHNKNKSPDVKQGILREPPFYNYGYFMQGV